MTDEQGHDAITRDKYIWFFACECSSTRTLAGVPFTCQLSIRDCQELTAAHAGRPFALPAVAQGLFTQSTLRGRFSPSDTKSLRKNALHLLRLSTLSIYARRIQSLTRRFHSKV